MQQNELAVRFDVYGYLAGKLWAMYDEFIRTGTKTAPDAILKNLSGKIIRPEQNSELRKSFYIAMLEDRIHTIADLSKIIGYEPAIRVAQRARLYYSHFRKAAEKEKIHLAGIQISIKTGITAEPEPIAKVFIIDPANPSYFLSTEVNWRKNDCFKNLLVSV